MGSAAMQTSDHQQLGMELRQAMRGLASSVSLIASTDDSGNRFAMTATSVTSLSMDPPSMLVCINRGAAFNKVMQGGRGFSINILCADHLALARLCSSRAYGEERFAQGQWRRDERGTPFLADAQAAVVCIPDARYAYGSHDIFVGKVVAVHLGEAIDPLVYADGSYRVLKEDVLDLPRAYAAPG